MLSQEQLEALAAEMESPRIERKASLSSKSKVEEAVCAFANDLPGTGEVGVVLVGADDKTGKPTGLAITDELLRNLTSIRSDGNILPFPNISVYQAVLDGVSKTTLVYHLAHMMVEQGRRVLLVDLDPQSNLTAMCLSEGRLEKIWPESVEHPKSVLGCVRPILRGVGDIQKPHVERLNEGLALVPGDLGLSTFEDKLSDAWPRALDRDEAAYRTLSSFHRLAEKAAQRHDASIVFFDVGPNLGAINRAALLAADFVVTPLAPDLYSMQGLRNLGPTLVEWRLSWKDRLDRNPDPDLELPAGTMQPLGYVVMQAGMRLSRPVRAYERWVRRMPHEYHESVLRDDEKPVSADGDPWCLGIMRHYQSLMPLAQDAQKPMFQLRPADGAIGAHMDAVLRCRQDFDKLASTILQKSSEMSAASSG